MKCTFKQGPPGPGGLLGELGKVGPPVSKKQEFVSFGGFKSNNGNPPPHPKKVNQK